MPDGQEQQSRELADEAVAEEFEPFVDVLPRPLVGVDVEGQDVVGELGGVLESGQLHVFDSGPEHHPVLVFAVVRQP